MSDRAALIDAEGNIVNVIVLTEGAKWSPPAGLTVVRDSDALAAPGGTYQNGAFQRPLEVDD